jgi:hypothetical protein
MMLGTLYKEYTGVSFSMSFQMYTKAVKSANAFPIYITGTPLSQMPENTYVPLATTGLVSLGSLLR